MIVKKRDGRLVEFDPNKIRNTIKYAALATEIEDDDVKENEEIFTKCRDNLLKAGYEYDEAVSLAEEQVDGYLMNGVYTEYDADTADDLVEMVEESLTGLGEEIIDVELIQDMIERALLDSGHIKTAKTYIERRASRDKVRDMNSNLMKTFEGITFKNSIDNDTKRENANIDGDSAMGTMLKYGSESAKQFNLLHLVSPEIADAHSRGDIHIHDLDFAALTETCISDDTDLTIRHKGQVRVLKAREFDSILEDYADDTVVNLDDYEILSGDAWVKIKNCVRHPMRDKQLLEITTTMGSLKVTSDHVIPLNKGNGIEVDTQAKDIKLGDKLISNKAGLMVDAEVTGISVVEGYAGYVYDFETENHYFNANGFKVHNCCQIDLQQLFKDGFSTGHGFLREPANITSASALTCIAIQSNQNDQHGGQSVPEFDYYLAEYVSKSYIKWIVRVLEDRFDLDWGSLKGRLDAYAETTRKDDIKHRALILNDKHNDKIKEIINEVIIDMPDVDRDDVEDITDKSLDHVLKMAKKRTDQETHQAMEALIHNLNTMHSRAGAQVPFSSINFGTDTSDEGRMVMKNLLLATEEGLGNGETAIFPVSVFKQKANVSAKPGDPNYDLFQLACRVSAKRMFPKQHWGLCCKAM